jgi:hypothetical protein
MAAIKKFKHIRFGWKHLLILFMALVVFHLFVSQLEENNMRNLLSETMDWYKRNSAEKIANLTTTSLELLLESEPPRDQRDKVKWERSTIHALNSILKQPLMDRNVEEMCVIVPYKNEFAALDLGQSVYLYFYDHKLNDENINPSYGDAIMRYASLQSDMVNSELVESSREEENIFHVFVPLETYGEYSGVVYMKIHPDVSVITQQILGTFNNTALTFSVFLMIGLLLVFYIATYTVMERDEAWELLFSEREAHLNEQVTQKKESLFTKRIYHAHHKAEKVMGFINEDLDRMTETNLKETKHRISKYANFVARVIYDMKWYNPPLQTIRSQLFKTNLNEVLMFLVGSIFQRTSHLVKAVKYNFDLDDSLPALRVNEFVIWEIFEPLIQNSIDHSDKETTLITITSKYFPDAKSSIVTIDDNGPGIQGDLLEEDETGIKRVFLESTSTKSEDRHHGYGCYLAYEISRRCGWILDAENLNGGGSRFILRINHSGEILQ